MLPQMVILKFCYRFQPEKFKKRNEPVVLFASTVQKSRTWPGSEKI